MKQRLIYILIFFSYFGYSQVEYHLPDILIRDKDTTELYVFPLGCHPEIEIHKIFYKKGIHGTASFMSNKNYKAEWKIIENKLYLSNIYSGDYYKNHYKASLDSLFSNCKNGLVFADWYTGNLYAPKGDFIVLSQSPYVKVYESEWELSVKEGEIIHKSFTSDNYYKSAYANKDSILSIIDKNLNWDNIPKLEKGKHKFYITIKTGNSKNDFSVKVRGIDNDSVKKEFIRVIKLLPDFNYYYRYGNVLSMIYTLSVTNIEEMRK